MLFNFKNWFALQEDNTQLMGTIGTNPGQPTPTNAAPNKKVNYTGNKGCRGGPGDCPVVKPEGCSGYSCPPPVSTNPIVGNTGGAVPAGNSGQKPSAIPVAVGK